MVLSFDVARQDRSRRLHRREMVGGTTTGTFQSIDLNIYVNHARREVDPAASDDEQILRSIPLMA